MDRDRKTAMYAGLLFLATIVFSIPAVVIYGKVRTDPNYVVGAGQDARVYLGASFELLTAAANIGTAVVLYRVVRRVSDSIAIGYVAIRTLESTLIVIGLISLLSVVTMRQDFASTAGADPALYIAIGKSLVAVHDWTFIIGPAFCAAIGNGIMLGYLMYRGELVPRPWAILGIAAGTIALASAVLQLFSVYENQSAISASLIVPEVVWELFLGIWLTFRGFAASPLLSSTVDPQPPRGV
jgi:hypothetical protein